MIGPADFGPFPPPWVEAQRPGDAVFDHRPRPWALKYLDTPGVNIYAESTIGDWGLAESGLEPALDELHRVSPFYASVIGGFYRRLRLRHQTAQAVELHGWARVAAANARAEGVNSQIECELSLLYEHRSQCSEEAADELASLAVLLCDNHLEANAAVAALGGSYVPSNPTLDGLPRRQPRSEAATAAMLGFSLPADDQKALLSPIVSRLLSLPVGAAIGVGVFSMSGTLPLDTLANDPPITLLAFALVLGVATCTAGAALVRTVFAFAAQRHALGKSWIGWGFVGLATLVFLVIIDAVIEQEGLLKPGQLAAELASLGGTPVAAQTSLAMVCASLILSLPYLGYAAVYGVSLGKRAALGKVRVAEEEEAERAEEERRQGEAYQAAQQAVGSVRILQHHDRVVREQLAWDISVLDHQIAMLEARRVPIQDELLDQDKRRLQQALIDLRGNQTAFDRLFEEAGEACGLMPGRRCGFWPRLWCWIRNLFHPRQWFFGRCRMAVEEWR